ncbi:hypothetical protein ADILRU_1413 [Leifsonia rubra CMS 76R]|nr:hypothetical protein ADILRU_1413 [Leifsonia rubra CMS 76R]
MSRNPHKAETNADAATVRSAGIAVHWGSGAPMIAPAAP